jgi:hypothetical protein
MAILGEKNIATNNGTWLAKVKDAGPITIFGIIIGIITPIANNNAAIVNFLTELVFIFSPPMCQDTLN